MVLLSLECAIVGQEGTFDVKIDDGEKVSALKDAIKAKNSKTITCDAKDLQLFLATKEKDGEAKEGEAKGTGWMDSGWAKAVSLDEHGRPQGLEQMEPTLWLKNAKHFGENFTPGEGQVHVLVVASVLTDKKRKRDAALDATEETKEIDFDEFLEKCPKQGSLPTEGDFLQLFEWNDQDCGEVKDITAIGNIVRFTGSRFFVRKEVLCILENLKRFKENFDSGDLAKQFVLLGGPGTGKSCVLALLCFYVAATTEQPVLWYRRVVGGRDEMVTRLFYKKKYYEWDDDNGKIYSRVHENMKSRTNGVFWPCLDGFDHKTVYSFCLRGLANFTLLATSGQFKVKNEGTPFVTLCLTPYWKLADLELLARALKKPTEDEIADRYFVSGGCLRDFLSVDAREKVISALDEVKTSEHARFLLKSLGSSSDDQIDRLRMRGVWDVADPTCYVKPSTWKPVVNSLFVLRHLTGYLEPKIFEEFIGIARGMKDDRLEGVALEGYFHALVRSGQPIVIDYCKYDNVSRKNMKTEWRGIMDEEMGSISCPPTSKIQWSGVSIDDCVRVMERWAADLPFADYWIPADSLCETIDAVAKCKFPDEKESRICFLQLTKAEKHKCDEDVLWKLAQPFVGKAKVCYIALMSLKDAEIRVDFRLKPAVLTRSEVLEHIPLYVARYRSGSIESTSS